MNTTVMAGVVAIVQARMGSTRLPGKVLEPIAGRSMLARVVQRVERAEHVERTVVATTDQPRDDAVADECGRLGVAVFRGDEQDVLDRYFGAARAHAANVVVRVTSDCPLIEPKIIDKILGAFADSKPDYASNTLERTYPLGLDAEVVTMTSLERARNEAHVSYQRVHVTPYLYQNPKLFKLLSVTNDQDRSAHRWTVDAPEDLELVRAIYDRLGGDGEFSWMDVLRLMEIEPALVDINCHIRQKTLDEG